MNSDTKVGIAVGALFVPFGAALAAYGIFTGGFILSRIWLWHAVPYGLPAIAWQTFGAMYIFKNVAFPRSIETKKSDKSGWLTMLELVSPWFGLGVAWVLK